MPAFDGAGAASGARGTPTLPLARLALDLPGAVRTWLSGQTPAALMPLRTLVRGERAAVGAAQGLLAAQLGRPAPADVASAGERTASPLTPPHCPSGPDDAVNPVHALLERMAFERIDIMNLASARTREGFPSVPDPTAPQSLLADYESGSLEGARQLRGTVDQRVLQAQAGVLAALEEALDQAIGADTSPESMLIALLGEPDHRLDLHVLRLAAVTPMREAAQAYLGQQRLALQSVGAPAQRVQPPDTEDVLRSICAESLTPIQDAERRALRALLNAAIDYGNRELGTLLTQPWSVRRQESRPIDSVLQEMVDTAWLARRLLDRYPDRTGPDVDEPAVVFSVAGEPVGSGYLAHTALARTVCVMDRPMDRLSLALAAAQDALLPIDRRTANSLEHVNRLFADALRLLTGVRLRVWPQIPLNEARSPPPVLDAAAGDWTTIMRRLQEVDEELLHASASLWELHAELSATPDDPATAILLAAVDEVLARQPSPAQMHEPDAPGAVHRLYDIAARVGGYSALQSDRDDPTGMGPTLAALDNLFADDAARRLLMAERPLWMLGQPDG
jgi:hypothetical protein